MAVVKNQGQKGFTLIELLVVIIVVGILSFTLAEFITNWLQTATLDQAHASLLNNAETAMDTITNDILLSGSAEQANRWPDQNGPGGNQYGWSSNSSTLVLAKVAVDSEGDVIFSDPADYITQKDDVIYYLSGTTLYRRILASDSPNDAAVTTCPPADATQSCPADTAVATDVSNFSLAYYDDNGQVSDTADARSVQVSLTLSTKVDSQTVSSSYTTRMVFRNE